MNIKQKDLKLLSAANHSNIAFSYKINNEPDSESVQILDLLEEKIQNDDKKFFDDILDNSNDYECNDFTGNYNTGIDYNFRDKYKVDSINLDNLEQNSSDVNKNEEEQER